MAKFRRNHASGRGGFASKMMLRVLVLFGAAIGAFYFFQQDQGFKDLAVDIDETADVEEVRSNYLPTGADGETVHHKHFSLSYNEKHEQANWVAYELTDKQIYAKNVKRSDYFEEDPSISTGSATFYDYKGSGYSKGHLVPSADRNYSREANVETFYMSNMSPQKRAFNGGIWNELEMNVRDWAVDNGSIVVVSGPILKRNLKKIGQKNSVSVPEAFYKVVLDHTKPELKAIAFIIPNERSDKPLEDYIVSIDEVERQTGIDFFDNFLSEELESELEAQSNANKWPFEGKWYMERVNVWNNQ